MIRLHCVVEGQTEEAFVNGLLRPELAAHDVLIDAHRITTSRRKGRPFRGGFVNYEHLKRDLILWMKQDRQPDSWFTTMIDLYRLPNDFPGRGEASAIPDPIQRAQRLERSLVDELQHPRFFAHIQVHEIEALLFSDVAQFEVAFPEQEHEIEQLRQIRASFPTPEHIDEGTETAPSKRILRLFPGYSKTVDAPVIARNIGLPAICRECAHFRGWLDAMHGLGEHGREPIA